MQRFRVTVNQQKICLFECFKNDIFIPPSLVKKSLCYFMTFGLSYAAIHTLNSTDNNKHMHCNKALSVLPNTFSRFEYKTEFKL